jgi:hypothetical protein
MEPHPLASPPQPLPPAATAPAKVKRLAVRRGHRQGGEAWSFSMVGPRASLPVVPYDGMTGGPVQRGRECRLIAGGRGGGNDGPEPVRTRRAWQGRATQETAATPLLRSVGSAWPWPTSLWLRLPAKHAASSGLEPGYGGKRGPAPQLGCRWFPSDL